MTDTSNLPPEVSPADEVAVNQAVEAAIAAFEQASTLDELKAARIAHTGDNAPLTLANRLIGKLDKTEKADAGKRMGQARGRMNTALATRQQQLQAEHDARMLVEETVDVTTIVRRRRHGARHPLELLQERASDIFIGMGWEIAEGPELESEWYNFDALNFEPDHPAREMQDTFFVEPADAHLLLRTHTSPVQIRAMLERGAPTYILDPCKTIRTD